MKLVKPAFPNVKMVAAPIKKIIEDLKSKVLSKSKAVIGLDVGSFAIKAVELKDTGSGTELVDFSVTPVNADKSEQNLSAQIKKTIENAKFSSREVVTSVSGPAVIVRHIQLPRMSEADLEGAIKFEAEKYIPFKINEVVLDSKILEKDSADGKMHVLLVAAKNDFITRHMKLIADAQLRVSVIDVGSLALINAFKFSASDEDKDKTKAILNIGASQTSVNIIKDGNSCFARDIMSAGNDLTQAISDKAKVDLAEAEALKCQISRKNDKLFSILRPVLDNLASEIRLSFDYYESQFEQGIDKIYLTGGSSALAGLIGFLADSLGVGVELWNSTSKLKINPEIDKDKLSSFSNQLSVAVGLGIRK